MLFNIPLEIHSLFVIVPEKQALQNVKELNFIIMPFIKCALLVCSEDEANKVKDCCE